MLARATLLAAALAALVLLVILVGRSTDREGLTRDTPVKPSSVVRAQDSELTSSSAVDDAAAPAPTEARRDAAPATEDAPTPKLVRFTVVVQDLGGQPVAGVDVVLVSGEINDPRRAPRAEETRVTGNDGRTIFEHDPAEMELHVALDFPRRQIEFVYVDPHAPREREVLITLPPAARVEYTVTHADGQAVEHPTRVLLHAPDAARGFEYEAIDDAKGTFLIDFGLPYSLSATNRGFHEPARETCPAIPSTIGRASHELVLGTARPVLYARVTLEGGGPAHSQSMLATLRTDAHGDEHIGARPDADGRISIPVTKPWSPGETRRVDFDHPSEHGLRGGFTESVDLSYELEPLTDLGEVLLTRPPLLIAGTVLRPNGEPAHFWRYNIERLVDGAWTQHEFGMSSKTGHFAEPANETSGNWRLVQERESAVGYVEPLAFEPGARDVVIQLLESCELIAPLLLDSPPDAFVLRAQLQYEPATEAPVELVILGAQIMSRNLRQGRAHLAVLLGDTELARIEDLTLAGGRVQDPRLKAIDLRGRIHKTTIELVNANGLDRRQIAVRYRDGVEGPFGWTARREDDAFVALSAGPTIDVLVLAKGMRTQEHATVSAHLTCTLQPGFQVELELAPALTELNAYPVPVPKSTLDGDPRFGETPRPDLGWYEERLPPADGTHRFVLPEAGAWHLGWKVRSSRDGRRDRIAVPPEDARAIEVAERDGPQRFRIGG